MKNITPEIGKGCFVVSYFDGDEWVQCGQFSQSEEAGVEAARIVGSTALDSSKITFHAELIGRDQ